MLWSIRPIFKVDNEQVLMTVLNDRVKIMEHHQLCVEMTWGMCGSFLLCNAF